LRDAAKPIENATAAENKKQDETQKTDKKSDKKLDVTVLPNKTTETEVIAEQAEKGYGMLVVGLKNTTVRGHKFSADVTQLAAGFEGPLTIVEARDGHIKDPPEARLSI